MPEPRRVSVVIPARNEAAMIGGVVEAVRRQSVPGTELELEVIVVDDGSTDETEARAVAAGARVLPPRSTAGGSPAAARNRGAAAATGDPIVFLDADCVPAPGWLAALLAAHDRGTTIVGGSLELAPGLGAFARCDHYCGAYHVHPRRAAGTVPSHPPANLSVRRDAFHSTRGFTETQPVADGHEELAWQAALARGGHAIRFEPAAMVWHHNRAGFGNLLRRNWRWGYSALESKARSGAARAAWVYRHPGLALAASVPLAPATAVYTVGCWLRAGHVEPLLMFPAVLAARLAWTAGFLEGGARWLRRARRGTIHGERPRWR